MRRHSLLLVLLLVGTPLHAADSFLSEAEAASLKAVPDVPGVSRYLSPGVDIADYNNILFGSVTLYFAASSKAKDIDAEEAKKVSDAMRAAMEQAAGAVERLHVSTEPGPSTALINVAITDIDMHKKKRGLLGYTPIGLVVTTAGNLAGLRMQLQGAKIQGELVDSVSGKVLSIFEVDKIAPQAGKDSITWDDVSSTFETLLEQSLIATKP